MEFRLPAITCKCLSWHNRSLSHFTSIFLSSGSLLSLTYRRVIIFVFLCPAFTSHLPKRTSSTGTCPAQLERICVGWKTGHYQRSATFKSWVGQLPVSYSPCSDFSALLLTWLKYDLQQVRNSPSYGASTGKGIFRVSSTEILTSPCLWQNEGLGVFLCWSRAVMEFSVLIKIQRFWNCTCVATKITCLFLKGSACSQPLIFGKKRQRS